MSLSYILAKTFEEFNLEIKAGILLGLGNSENLLDSDWFVEYIYRGPTKNF